MTTTKPNRYSYGGWITFRYLEQNAIERKEIQFPSRHRLLVRTALGRVGLRYREVFPFYNPTYHGHKNQTEGSIQWADFIVFDKQRKRIFAIQFKLAGGAHRRTKERYGSKIKYLEQRGIPVLELKRGETAQIYEMRIHMFLRKVARQ
jgi:hypothetical protein